MLALLQNCGVAGRSVLQPVADALPADTPTTVNFPLPLPVRALSVRLQLAAGAPAAAICSVDCQNLSLK